MKTQLIYLAGAVLLSATAHGQGILGHTPKQPRSILEFHVVPGAPVRVDVAHINQALKAMQSAENVPQEDVGFVTVTPEELRERQTKLKKEPAEPADDYKIKHEDDLTAAAFLKNQNSPPAPLTYPAIMPTGSAQPPVAAAPKPSGTSR